MKIPYKHIVKYISSNPKICELSEKLFQLGHEHEIIDDIFDFEFTPNRGDCLSLNGLLRDLRIFYDISYKKDIYKKNIEPLEIKFINNAKNFCKKISFLKIDVDQIPKKYETALEDFFTDLENKKINFFTDISNYISYETGQPTHCYDSSLIKGAIELKVLNKNAEFITLLNKRINVDQGDLVFSDSNEIINLAGIIGGKNSACTDNTKSVLIECAYFEPEIVLGRSVKYDLNSDAAHKFERNTDCNCHDYVLRRFIKVVESHTNIKKIQIFSKSYSEILKKEIPFNINKIQNILGFKLKAEECLKYLTNLEFSVQENIIKVPSHRNDINSINDIAEEIARAVGYDNIKKQIFKISSKKNLIPDLEESKIKKLLINEGFYEVINYPFVNEKFDKSVKVDNPIDSNRKYLRLSLKDSLLENLLFNERRQKDSIKLFEISDIYSNETREGKRVIGIVASGRVGKNYAEFSKRVNDNYLKNILNKVKSDKYNIEIIPRESLDSKLKDPIIYCEIDINSNFLVDYTYDHFLIKNLNQKQFIPISEFPSSHRDLSFSISDFSKCKELEEYIINIRNDLLKEIFIFDYFKNEKSNVIKIGFRFIFQSSKKTITDKEVNEVMDIIISNALRTDSVSIPGLN